MPKVSVIMGIYNCADTLSEAIESIINQTFKDWEVIMCDDGSLDRTLEIAQMYAQKYDNIKVYRNEKNMGLNYTLNHCLKYIYTSLQVCSLLQLVMIRMKRGLLVSPLIPKKSH